MHPGIASAFVARIRRPVLVLPSQWCSELAREEMDAVVGHELAHLRGGDLPWAIAWRCMMTLAWPHPLVWGAGRAHRLACEEEADRVASELEGDRPRYVQRLARLALRAVSHPAGQLGLVFQATSDLGHRLDRLGEPPPSTLWRRRASLIGAVLLLILLGSATWRIASKAPGPAWGAEAGAPTRGDRRMRDVVVSVVDDQGRPVRGAILKPDGLREHHNTASHYSWIPEQHGPRTPVTTDAQGRAVIRYPEYVVEEEHLRTVQISFSVNHPDFSPARPTTFPVDGSGEPVRLTPGARVEVSAFYGPGRLPIEDLVPNLSGHLRWKWNSDRGGRYVCNQVTTGPAMIQLMGTLPDGGIGFSEARPFLAEAGRPSVLSFELKPGIRLEGQLDARVPRPVRNGRVVICVRPPEFPALVPDIFYKLRQTYGDFECWSTHRVIDADGRFVFESLPPGEASLTVHGDGFCSTAGTLGPAGAVPPAGFGVPQNFPLVAPVTRYTVETESTAALRFRVVDLADAPVPGATVYVNPNVLLIGTGIFGDVSRHRHGEEPLASPPSLPAMPYSAVTDGSGMATIRDVPAFTSWYSVEHPNFVMRMPQARNERIGRLRTKLLPGSTNEIQVVVEPKGRTFVGEVR
jgi:hypothetical protein